VQERYQLSPPGNSPYIGSLNDTNGTEKKYKYGLPAVSCLGGKWIASQDRHRKN